MSGRAVSHPRSALAGLVLAFAVFAGAAPGQSPLPPVSPPGGDDVDDRPPLPPEEPKRPPVAAEYRFPNPGARIYREIQDHTPVRSEKENRDEYQAWTEVVSFARSKDAAGLERHAARDLTSEDLRESASDRAAVNGPSIFRLELLRFDGKVTKVRRIAPTKALAERGVKDLYEAWLVPADEPPSQAVCVVFTDLPAGLEMGAQPADRWATFAGYFFKMMRYPGPDAEEKPDPAGGPPKKTGWLSAPLLVGRTVTLSPGPAPEANRIELDKNLRIFRCVRDNSRLLEPTERWEEHAAWALIARHARRFGTAELERAAARNVKFADLFREHRLDFQFDLIHLEGRLIGLWRKTPPAQLAEVGVPCYEGWVIPKEESSGGNPVCILMTELPAGLEPQPGKPDDPLLNRYVTFAGYSFKLYQYRSGEYRKDRPTEKVMKRAPLLIGRSVTMHDDPASGVRDEWRYGFVLPMLGVLGVILAVALGLGWYFRRGDRRVRAEVEARTRNPFGEPAG
jgi:hypothetical protein